MGIPNRFHICRAACFFAVGLLLVAASAVTAVENIACIGNSITEANKKVYASVGVPVNKGGYVSHLDTLMGDEYTTTNYGRGGRYVARAETGNSSYWNNDSYTIAREAEHSIYVMMFGTNDSKEDVWNEYGADFAEDYAALAESLTVNNPDAIMFLCRPLPIWGNDYGCRGSVLVDSIIPIIDSIAATDGYHLIDLYTPMLDMEEHIPDGVHPDSVAAKVIAGVVRDAIMQNVATRNPGYARSLRMGKPTQGYELYIPAFSSSEMHRVTKDRPTYMLNGKSASLPSETQRRPVITVRPLERNR